MSLAQLSTWIEDLKTCGSATFDMNMQLAAVPQKTASASKYRRAPFTSNWTLDQTGAWKKKRSTSSSGALVTATPTLTEDPDVLRIALKSHVVNVQIEKLTVADRAQAGNKGPIVPMELHLPNHMFQDLNVEFSLEYDQAIILAHQIIRARTKPEVREHILYVAVLSRSPVRLKKPASPDESLHQPRNAIALYWPQSPDDTQIAFRETQESPVAVSTSKEALSREALIARLQGLRETALLDSGLLGIIIEGGSVASFDACCDRDYVCGLTPPPSSDNYEPRTFDIKTARSGMSLQCALNEEGDDDIIEVTAHLAASPRIVTVSEELPMPGNPLDGELMKQFTFQKGLQQVAEIEQRLSPEKNCVWEVMPLVRTLQSGTPVHNLDVSPMTWALLLYQSADQASCTMGMSSLTIPR